MEKLLGVLILVWFCHPGMCDDGKEDSKPFNASTAQIMDEILQWFIDHDEIDNRTVWERWWSTDPCKSLDDVVFYLYPNWNLSDYDILNPNDLSSLENARWKPGAPVKILVHGFENCRDTLMPQIIKNAYLRHEYYSGEKANVVIVDWGCYAMNQAYHVFPWYMTALEGVPKTGVKVGKLMKQLLSMENGMVTDSSEFHIVGHSLGAHVAGQAGDTFKSLTNQTIGRITGLDPAGPGFKKYKWYNPEGWILGEQRHLKNDDATVVDIIHTSWGSLGINEEIGDVEFYPNDDASSEEEIMPGCKGKNGWLGEELAESFCSHRKAPIYFAVSIIHSLSNKLIGCGCEARDNHFNPEIINGCKSTCKHPCVFGEGYKGPCDIRTNFVTVPQGNVSFESPGRFGKAEQSNSAIESLVSTLIDPNLYFQL